jgi:hypothetical protein
MPDAALLCRPFAPVIAVLGVRPLVVVKLLVTVITLADKAHENQMTLRKRAARVRRVAPIKVQENHANSFRGTLHKMYGSYGFSGILTTLSPNEKNPRKYGGPPLDLDRRITPV